jgi:uncharacterized protein
VLRLSRFAKTLCDKHGVRLSGGLSTNGYGLTKELVRELIECNQTFFQITLDGWGEQHDKTRLRADGRGTFEVIWANLLAMKEFPHSFTVVLRIHVHGENLENLERLMAEIAKAFGGDERYQLDFQYVRYLGGEGVRAIKPVSAEELPGYERRFRAICASETRKVLGLPQEERPPSEPDPQPLSEQAAFRAKSTSSHNSGAPGEPHICYATRPNSLLIRSNARLGKCTVALDDPRNDLGYIAEDGTIVVNNDKLGPWIRGLASLEIVEAACPLRGMFKEQLPSPYPGGKMAIPIKVIPATTTVRTSQ